jgi:hypothetical protein
MNLILAYIICAIPLGILCALIWEGFDYLNKNK